MRRLYFTESRDVFNEGTLFYRCLGTSLMRRIVFNDIQDVFGGDTFYKLWEGEFILSMFGDIFDEENLFYRRLDKIR